MWSRVTMNLKSYIMHTHFEGLKKLTELLDSELTAFPFQNKEFRMHSWVGATIHLNYNREYS